MTTDLETALAASEARAAQIDADWALLHAKQRERAEAAESQAAELREQLKRSQGLVASQRTLLDSQARMLEGAAELRARCEALAAKWRTVDDYRDHNNVGDKTNECWTRITCANALAALLAEPSAQGVGNG